MDNPLMKLGWKPLKHEPVKGNGEAPEKLCQHLAENPILSFFLTPDMRFKDKDGNEFKIERWMSKQRMMDGAFQHTYIEFDSRL